MKKRSTELFLRLLKEPSKDIMAINLIEEFQISEKTLRNDIQEIDCFLREISMPKIITFDGQKLTLNQTEYMSQLLEAIYGMDSYHYKMSLEERMFYIIIILLDTKGYYSMQQFAKELYVTRNTIINDCKQVDGFLKTYHISFVAQSKKGIKIFGEKQKINDMLIDMFHILIPKLKFEQSFFVQYIIEKAKFMYSLPSIINLMNHYMSLHNIIFGKEVFYEIVICMFVLLNRFYLSQDNEKEKMQDMSDEQEKMDIIGGMIAYIAKSIGLSGMRKKEVQSIEKTIILRGLYPQVYNVNDFELYGVISHFLFGIGDSINVNMQSDGLLMDSLVSHIKNMENWNETNYARWDINHEYELYGDFQEIWRVAEPKFYMLEKYLPFSLNQRMKESIVIHIGAAMLRSRKNIQPCNVIVTCPGSIATSRYLEAQIKNYFCFSRVEVMSMGEIEHKTGVFDGIDFIISTVPLVDVRIPVVVVSPLLTAQDVKAIRALAVHVKEKDVLFQKVQRYPVLDEIQEIFESGDEEKITYLEQKLEGVLAELVNVVPMVSKGSMLQNMLKLEYISIVTFALEWRQAMIDASESLLRDGFMEESYRQAAIKNIEKYGNYIIVNQGVALAHAHKDSGAKKDGLSLLIAKDGVHFDGGDVVYLFFFFVQESDMDYLELFKEIIKLGDEQAHIKQVIEAEDKGKVLEILGKIFN
ncbi:MAG: PTS sugar transporter subunit IIA [Lachnospiraceae bacterium]|nr:PTS sugar transporter subunit IIA [Lachnospiraceae bacterium]